MTKNFIKNKKNIGSHFIKSYSTCLKWHIKDKCAPVDGSPEYSRGALLLELLVVISILAIILTIGANATYLSMRGNKTSGENGVATSLATETLEAIRSIVEEDYQNIYGLPNIPNKGPANHYYTTQSAGKWIIAAGNETVVLNGITYTRYFTVDNVSRDDTTRNIQTAYSSTYDDPSTQKVTVTVSWTGGTPIVMSEYFFRWKNKICGQPGWLTTNVDNTVINCTDTSYFTKDAAIDATNGTLKLQ